MCYKMRGDSTDKNLDFSAIPARRVAAFMRIQLNPLFRGLRRAIYLKIIRSFEQKTAPWIIKYLHMLRKEQCFMDRLSALL